MPIKNAFEMLIKIFKSDGTQLVKSPSDFDTIIRMGIASVLGRNQQAMVLPAQVAEFLSVVVTISQDETDLTWQFAQQRRRWLVISNLGRRQFRSQGDPDRGYHRDQVQFPAIDPAMPARFGPMRFLINRGMGNEPFLARDAFDATGRLWRVRWCCQ